MSKALVIKGANFALNKVETVTISEPIPCTGLLLSDSTYTFTTIGDTKTLTATVVPADTTDELTWVSSDTDVATVEDGVVTCVGVGPATITAMCGIQSATCELTCTHVMTFSKTQGTYTPGYGYSGSIDLANNKDWIGFTTSSWKRAYYSETDILGGYRAFYKTGNAGKYLIPIPNGATHAIATVPSGITYVHIILADSKIKSLGTGADGDCAAAVHAPYSLSTTSQDISGTTADGFVVNLTCNAATDIETISGDVIVTFS